MPHYWKILFSRSWDDTLVLMGGQSLPTTMIAIAVFICTILLIRHYRGHETMKDFFWEIFFGVVATLIVGLIVFGIHFFILTPPKIYAESLPAQNNPTIPSFLPTKTIPLSEPLAITNTQPMASKPESEPALESFNSSTDVVADPDVLMANAKLESQRKAELDARQKIESRNNWWTNALPYYERAIIHLQTILNEKLPNGDGISQTLRPLPQEVTLEHPDVVGRKLAEFQYQKHTNMDFIITAKPNWDDQRPLLISCSSGSFEIHPFGNIFSRTLIFSDFTNTEESNIEFSDKFIDSGLRILIRRQEKDSNLTQ